VQLRIHRDVNPSQAVHTLSTYLLSILLRNHTWELHLSADNDDDDNDDNNDNDNDNDNDDKDDDNDNDVANTLYVFIYT
jgi:hypothetical protein